MEDGAIFSIVHELTKGANVPVEVTNEHIVKLQSLVGLKSGTVQQLAPKMLQETAALCANQADFLAKFNLAIDENCQNVVPMVEVLHGIMKDDVLRRHLMSRSTATLTSDGPSASYQALKEKLLQQVESRVTVDSSATTSGPGLRTGPFNHRSLLTLDFVPSQKVMSICTPPPTAALGCLPVASQEYALVQDLLYCFLGVSGVHLTAVLGKREVTFRVDPQVDPSLKDLTDRITPLCNYYSVVVRFMEKHSLMTSGKVNQAFAGALHDVVGDYYTFVAQLENLHRRGQLSLSKIWSLIQPSMEAMRMISELCQLIDRQNARGGKTLSLLHEKCIAHATSYSEALQQLSKALVRAAAAPYFTILDRWIHKGVIVDYGKDFFVEDNELIERAVLPLEYSDDYWERRYTIKCEKIPAFLHSHANKILRTGKYLNVIQQCDQARSLKRGAHSKPIFHHASLFVNKMTADDEHDDVDQGDWVRLGVDTRQSSGQPELIYVENPDCYTQPLERAYVFASKTLLDLLVAECDLIGHLKSVKHYFLLDQGDFIVQFMDLCDEELCQNVQYVEPTRLESLLELALRTSSVNCDPYKDNVRVELLPYDLIFQMCKILSIDTDPSKHQFQEAVSSEHLTALEAFAFGYDVQWPISLILNRKSLACYQMLFRHLLYCKHVEKLLSNVWMATKSLKGDPRSLPLEYAASFALNQKMLHFLQNLEYHMTFEVLEPSWEDMIVKIRSGKVTNVDQVLQIHSDFLSTCLNDCLLSNPQLLTTVKKLMEVCCQFAAYMAILTNDQDLTVNSPLAPTRPIIAAATVETFREDVKKFDLQFSAVLASLLDKMALMARENYNENILNIVHRLDFNGFYSRSLDKFAAGKST